MPLNKEKLRQYYLANPWKRRAVLFFLSLIILLIILRIILTPVIIYGATSWLKKQGIDSSIEDIGFNFTDSAVTLINAKGQVGSITLFNIGLVTLDWSWTPLSNKKVEITGVELKDFKVNIKQYNDQLIIGGVHITSYNNRDATTEQTASDTTETEETEETEEIKPWALSLGKVVFTNLNICYLYHSALMANISDESRYLDYCVDLKRMQWGGTISYATDPDLLKTDDVPVSSVGTFSLDGLTITDNKQNKKLLLSNTNSLKNVVVHGLNNISIDTLTMNGLSALQRDSAQHKDTLRFDNLLVNNIHISNLNDISIEDIIIEKPGLYLVKHGKQVWEHHNWLPKNNTADKQADATATNNRVEPDTSLKLAINNTTINEADFCYKDNAQSIYYCYNHASLEWAGHVQFNSDAPPDSTLALQGNLTLQTLKLRNVTLGRDLLNFESLNLKQLALKNNITTLSNLTLKQLTALQRGSKQSDNTASFDSLTINDVAYGNNKISIDTITLAGLSNTLSKNKKSGWEHDKWRTTSTKTKKESVTNNSARISKTPAEKPLAITLHKITVKTKNPISFIDNSTQPKMEVGLTQLHFTAAEFDSLKPTHKSPVKLFAKTTRHSTIDIKGNAQPLAEKISFDITGELKGFDLRAGSPAAKKAIGHIIQSGQMDADLTLLSEQGQLDSNIALSLYQFNIKPMSKKDSEKLDSEFGLPLNQTLVLLRDKDDSIHLDIPITGDISNPDFDPMHAIVKATSKAATVALITFYTPYGLVYAGGNLAFNLATALNFDPIIFTPGVAELSSVNKEKLDKLSKLLIEKPNVHLTLCGVTSKNDTFALYPKIKQQADNSKKENKPLDIALKDEQLTALEALARKRQVDSKNYLVKKHSITHDRLILCSPEHRSDETAIAGVEINI